MVALQWIKEVHKLWGVWVQNREEVIQVIHISTNSLSIDRLDFVHWFHDPQFLLDYQENWPSKKLLLSAETKLEEQRIELAVNIVHTAFHGIGKVLN